MSPCGQCCILQYANGNCQTSQFNKMRYSDQCFPVSFSAAVELPTIIWQTGCAADAGCESGAKAVY